MTPELGKIITTNAHRDAVHVAVAPVEAPTDLNPGQHVDQLGNVVGEHVGIVDPFLNHPVRKGQRFYLCLYPNTVTALRHEWEHLAFATAPAVAADKAESRRWIEEIAANCGVSYDRMMAVATCAAEGDDDTYIYMGDNEDYKTYFYDHEEEFWTHFEVVTGLKVQDDHKRPFFSCSC